MKYMGPLFFGFHNDVSCLSFDIQGDPDSVIIDFAESRIMDQSAIETINKLAEKYQSQGKNLHLRHVSADCRRLISKAEKICDVKPS